MSTPSASGAGDSISDLGTLIEKDIQASKEIQGMISSIKQDLEEGNLVNCSRVLFAQSYNKDVVKDLVTRLEHIDDQQSKTPTDREMMQILNRRLAVCDQHKARLAELNSMLNATQGLLDRDWNSNKESEEEKFAKQAQKPLPGDVSIEQASISAAEAQVFHDSTTAPGDEYSDAEDELETEKEAPLLFHMLGVSVTASQVDLDRAYKRLGMAHDPKHKPNDPGAPARWAAIMKAYKHLSHPDARTYYEIHGKAPAELENFDISTLSIN